MLIADKWRDFELLDLGGGEKLERWGRFVLSRPDPQVIWPRKEKPGLWSKADAHYVRSSSGGGSWEYRGGLPGRWEIGYGDLKFSLKAMGFKHTGLFPEQAVNWDWMRKRIGERLDRDGRIGTRGRAVVDGRAEPSVNVLNLFAYTGAASVACAAAGASVCHVDAAKEIVRRAKENLHLSGLGDRPVRFITDDVIKFVKREIRRGRKYEAVVMDPPSFGRGPDGEIWKIENQLYDLVELCSQLMSDRPLFFLINSYTTGFAPGIMEDLLQILLVKRFGGKVSSDTVGLHVRDSNLVLPCGIVARRWV